MTEWVFGCLTPAERRGMMRPLRRARVVPLLYLGLTLLMLAWL